MTSIILHHWAIYVYLTWVLIVIALILCQRRAEGRTAATSVGCRQDARAVLRKLPSSVLTPAACQMRMAATKGKHLRKTPRPAGRETLAWEYFAYSI